MVTKFCFGFKLVKSSSDYKSHALTSRIDKWNRILMYLIVILIAEKHRQAYKEKSVMCYKLTLDGLLILLLRCTGSCHLI